MAASEYNVVLISYRAEPPRRLEGEAGGALTPGMLVLRNSDGEYVAHNDDAPAAPHAALFADINPFGDVDAANSPIDTAYAEGDWLRVIHAQPGDVINALIETGADVAIGAALESNGAGALQAATTGHPVATALEAVDNDSGGNVRIKVEVI